MIPVTRTVYEAIMAVRERGACNMFDWRGVLAQLSHMGEHDAYLWVYDHKADYLRALRDGFAVDGQGDPRQPRQESERAVKQLVRTRPEPPLGEGVHA